MPQQPIKHFMTPAPHGIEPNETLDVARRRMQELRVRHLPVRSGGEVVGMLSERDLYVLSAFPEIDFKRAKVGFSMTLDPYCVSPDTPARDVALAMAERRIGSALVVDEDRHLLGIFTDTDSLSALADALDRAQALESRIARTISESGPAKERAKERKNRPPKKSASEGPRHHHHDASDFDPLAQREYRESDPGAFDPRS